MRSVFSRSTRLAVVAALPVLLAAKPLSAPLSGGTTYDFVVRSETGGKESITMRGRGAFAGNEARIDIVETMVPGDAFGSKGSYFLVKEGGKKMLLVDPANKQYMEWDIANMLSGLSKLTNAMGGMVKMEMSDVKIDAQNLGAGETIQGYKTEHYRLVQNYTVNMKVFGRSSKSRSETTTDYYFAPALKGLSNPFVSSGEKMGESFDMFNNPDFKSQMAAARSKIEFGVPLKTLIKTIRTDDKGKQTVSNVTSEMLNFKNTDVPKSLFAIPADYKLIEMPKIDANMAAGNDTKVKVPDVNADSIAAAAKEGAKDAAKDEAKAAAKEAAAKKIRGIFRH